MTLGGFLGGVLFQALATIINIIASVIDWFMNLDTNLNTAGEAASTFVNTVVEFIGSLPGKIGEFINSILTKIGEWKTKMVNKAKEVGSQFKEAIVEKFNEVVDWFKGLPGRILDAIGDLGSTLFSAGQDLINGLFDGVNNIWSGASDVFGTITSAIPNLKGPEEVDKKLLEPNGEMIINSLFNGFDKAWEKSKSKLSDFTSAISSDFTLNASGGAGVGKTVNYYIDGINVNATSDGAFAEEFVNLMMRYKRLGNA
jgi:phage-related protein